jgi:uncharacterized protein YxeA
MPRTNIDYSKIIIYKIICNDTNITELYVGSTTLFKRRKTQHKTSCINVSGKAYNLKIYKTIRDNGGWDNWEMLEIEKFPCTDGNEARARERHYFDLLNASLNTLRPFISEDEKYKKATEQRQKSRNKLRTENWHLYCIRKNINDTKYKIKHYDRDLADRLLILKMNSLPVDTIETVEEYEEHLIKLNELLIEELKKPKAIIIDGETTNNQITI